MVVGSQKEGMLMEFTFSGKHGDNNGYLYWLGTEGKTKKYVNPHSNNRVRVTSSGMKDGSEAGILSRKRTECRLLSDPAKPVWLCLDFGRTRLLEPSHVTLCHGSAKADCDLTNFTFEGHDGSSSATWVDLSVARPHLQSAFGVDTFKLAGNARRFRFIRIISTGNQANGENALSICAFEFYGRLYRNK